ncbi:MAG: hypothetical protein JW937_08830 [Candidatus Omnitrophica bacterium]|nr:hypothetical protein [Candidatus Omnitrophota bacterium]
MSEVYLGWRVVFFLVIVFGALGLANVAFAEERPLTEVHSAAMIIKVGCEDANATWENWPSEFWTGQRSGLLASAQPRSAKAAFWWSALAGQGLNSLPDSYRVNRYMQYMH